MADRKDGHETIMWKPYEKWERDYIREKYDQLPAEFIAKKLGRTFSAVTLQARKMGVAKVIPKWTEEQLERLKDGIRIFIDWERVAQYVGRSAYSCREKSLEAGMRQRSTFWTDERIEELVRMREVEKLSWGKIGEHFNKRGDTVSAAYKRYLERTYDDFIGHQG